MSKIQLNHKQKNEAQQSKSCTKKTAPKTIQKPVSMLSNDKSMYLRQNKTAFLKSFFNLCRVHTQHTIHKTSYTLTPRKLLHTNKIYTAHY